jgi:hypothetical protein
MQSDVDTISMFFYCIHIISILVIVLFPFRFVSIEL